MTPNSYEELEARLRAWARRWSDPDDIVTALVHGADALADLRKQRDEAVARADVQSRNATNARRFVNEYHQENATLRAENERLTRERDADALRGDYSAGLSGGGINIRGDPASIAKVKEAVHNADFRLAIIEELRPRTIAAEAEAERLRKALHEALEHAINPPHLSSKED